MKKISEMKVGEKLVFGKYYPAPAGENAEVSWLKATKDNIFISEYVLDVFQRDISRVECDFEQTPLCIFLNSSDTYWNTDNIPVRPSFARHHGFLHGFEDYEVSCLVPFDDGIMISLPSMEDMCGDHAFPLWKRKGMRAPLSDAAYMVQNCSSTYYYYWLRSSCNDGTPRAFYLDGSAHVSRAYTHSFFGIRPICKLTDVNIIETENGYRLEPFEVMYDMASDDELYTLLCK